MNPYKTNKTFTAVIAAAGMSSRMGDFKPLLPLGDASISRRLIVSFLEAGAQSVTVVTGYKAEALEDHLSDLPVRLIYNAEYETSEMFDSILLGLRFLQNREESVPDKIFICPADLPLIRPETIALLADQEAAVVIPLCHERRGHPVCVTSAVLPGILSHDGTDGLRGALRAFRNETLFLPVPDPGILADADTMEDYERIKKACGEVTR